ncbi:MAG: hypothetical protein IPM54_10815 [Polyangiaceae bacterium]|nr:hypothetical protein [Polyangiaceae bacterium]
MSKEAIEEFAELLVCHVRDVSIQQCDMTLGPDYRGPDGQRWRAAAVAAGGQAPASMVIPDCVDTTIFEVLRETDDQEILHLSFTTNHGEIMDLLVEGGGELGGWYIGTGEWRPMYSKERFIDDFADIPTEWGIATPELAPILEELPMPRRAIEELGQLLVRHVRDVAIQSCDLQLLPHSQTPWPNDGGARRFLSMARCRHKCSSPIAWTRRSCFSPRHRPRPPSPFLHCGKR